MSKKIELDGETADRITALTLKEHRSYLKKEFKKGEYSHPCDVALQLKEIEAFNLIIKYFGEE